MPPKSGTKQTFIVEDLSFFLNLAGQTSSGLTKDKIVEKLGPVDSKQLALLKQFKSVIQNAEFINEIESMGWFHKNYETVKKHVEVYFERLGLPFVYNKPKKVTDKEDIAKLLFFCRLKGHTVTCKTYTLDTEQQEVVDISTGITLINSSAGTGKTTTGVGIASKYMDEGVLVVAYTNAAVKNFIQRLYEVVNDARQISKEPEKKIWVTTIDTICRSNSRGVYKNVDFGKRINAANRDLEQKTDIFLDHENSTKYRHLVIDECQDVDDDRFKYLFNIFRTWEFESMTIIGDPKQRMNLNAGGIFEELFGNSVDKNRFVKDKAVKWDKELLRWVKPGSERDPSVVKRESDRMAIREHLAVRDKIPFDRQKALEQEATINEDIERFLGDEKVNSKDDCVHSEIFKNLMATVPSSDSRCRELVISTVMCCYKVLGRMCISEIREQKAEEVLYKPYGTELEDFSFRDVEAREEKPWYLKCYPLSFRYHTTFRQLNPDLLDIANHLSSIRPRIHAQVHLHESLTPVERKKVVKMSNIQEVAAEIDALVRGGVRPNEICLMSPVTEKQSKIRQNFRNIQQLLSDRQIICDDQLRENTIYSTSIISAKGLEFNYVFFIGASRFPSFLQGSLSDANDGLSMNYVANTRARLMMYYLTDGSNLPPDSVPQKYVTGEVVKRTNYAKLEIYRHSIKSTDITPSNHRDYEDRNRPFLKIVQRDITQYILEKGKFQHFTYEIISYVLTSLGGYNKFQLDDEYAVLEEKDYRQYVQQNRCVECSMKTKTKIVTTIPEGTEGLANSLSMEGDEEDVTYHKNYALLMNNRPSVLESLSQIAEPCTQLTKLVGDLAEKGTTEDTEETAEHITYGTFMKAPVIQGYTYAIIFTESVFMAASYKASNVQKTVIMVGLESGRFIEIVSTPSVARRYNKVCQDLYTLTSSVRLMQERGKFTLANLSKEGEIYFVDTEFTSTAWNKSGSVYEIAVINAFKPYRSFVTYLKPDIDRFRIMVGDDSLQYNHIKDSPSVFDFISIFNTFNTPSKTTIYYFSTMHDVAVFYETHRTFHRAWGLSDDDSDDDECVMSTKPTDWKYDPDEDYGYTFINGRAGSGAGRLNDVYNRTTGSSLQNMPHLVHHVAISDAMMLMEYVLVRDHPVGAN